MAEPFKPGYYAAGSQVTSGGRLFEKKKAGNANAIPSNGATWKDIGPAPVTVNVDAAIAELKGVVEALTNEKKIIADREKAAQQEIVGLKARISEQEAELAQLRKLPKIDDDKDEFIIPIK